MNLFISWIGSLFTGMGYTVIGVALIAALIIFVFKRVLPSWVAPTIILVLGFAFFGVVQIKNAEITGLISERDKLITESQVKLAQDTVKVRSTETALVTASMDTTKELNAEIKTLTRRRNALLDSLRIAKNTANYVELSPTTAATGNGEATTGNYGSQLPATIGVEDVEEAERADTIRLHLAKCYTDYYRAKDALKGLNQ